jgi:hypothetical protein
MSPYGIFWLTTQLSHARRAGRPSLLNNWAMLSGDDIIESGEIKGVVLCRLDRLFVRLEEACPCFSGLLLQGRNIRSRILGLDLLLKRGDITIECCFEFRANVANVDCKKALEQQRTTDPHLFRLRDGKYQCRIGMSWIRFVLPRANHETKKGSQSK